MNKSIMIQGTASDVGKSLIVAGLCRIYSDRGVNVFPFKSQNMALNSYITATGDEMSRAQMVQSEAARRAPDIRMNPVLLKPLKGSRTSIIFNGKQLDTIPAREYYKEKWKLKAKIKQIYDEVASENELVIIEGAGSPAEINLNKDDFVNMGMAEIADSPVILVADIDRGGVFASIYGTIKLLSDEEQSRIKGIIINKFRGDISLLKDGLTMIEELVDVPVIGVIPYIDLKIDSEDSLALNHLPYEFDTTKDIDVAVLKLDWLKNFNEFNSLSMFEDVSVRYIDKPSQLKHPDVLIIPDTEEIEGNLSKLKQEGWISLINDLATKGTNIIAFGNSDKLLDAKLQSRAIDLDENQVKETLFEKDWEDIIEGNILTVNFTGLFEYLNWTRNLLNHIRLRSGKLSLQPPQLNYSEFKNQQYDVLANHLKQYLDLDALDRIINKK